MKLSVLIPVYNEEKQVVELLRRVAAAPVEKEIIVVDDCSRDRSWALIQAANIPELRVFRHTINQGKGAGIQTALKQATGEVVLIQDADLEYDPNDYPKLLAPIQRGEAQVVYGARNLGGQKAMMRLGNQFLTFVTNLLFGAHLTDMETCYKVIPTELMRSLALKADRFQIEPEITGKLLRRGVKIVEVPVFYAPREEKKLNPWKDGLPALTMLFQCRFGQ